MSQMSGMGLQGMDTYAVRGLGNQLRAGAEALRGAEGLLTHLVGAVRWVGPDARTFRDRWESDLRIQLLRAAEALDDAAGTAHRNAAEQEHASAL